MTGLGQLERRVMDVLWADLDSWMSVRDVADQLPEYAYTTILTILSRLQRKGLVRRMKDGRAFHYRAGASREEYTVTLMRDAMDAVPDRAAVLARFVESVSANEAESMRAAISKLKLKEQVPATKIRKKHTP